MIIAGLILDFMGANTPPTIEEVEAKYYENKEDLCVIADYLTCIESDNALLILDENEIMIEFVRSPIEDERLLFALENIKKAGYEANLIGKKAGTVSIMQWSGIKDIGCGIAYLKDKKGVPAIQYATQIKPLKEEGWYYYVDDYNAWRNGVRPSLTNPDTTR